MDKSSVPSKQWFTGMGLVVLFVAAVLNPTLAKAEVCGANIFGDLQRSTAYREYLVRAAGGAQHINPLEIRLWIKTNTEMEALLRADVKSGDPLKLDSAMLSLAKFVEDSPWWPDRNSNALYIQNESFVTWLVDYTFSGADVASAQKISREISSLKNSLSAATQEAVKTRVLLAKETLPSGDSRKAIADELSKAFQ